MSSVVFNSFKQRFLNGEVPHEDEWKFIPVNRMFTKQFGQDEFPIEQYRSLGDFLDHNASGLRASYFEGIRRDIYWYKPAETDEVNKPMFITSGSLGEKGKYDATSNWEDFQQTDYIRDVSSNSAISGYLASGGFYYIRTKDELRWFAARANTGNNRIIGVLGDGIDGVIRGQIGANEDYPFQGVLDGNGHTLGDIAIVCDNADNGLVGVLGCDGVVKNIKLKNTQNGINMLCEKRIDLNHIKTDGRDINAGLLVGRNYGRIENIDGSELSTFKFSGFVPQVYSVTNKSDDYDDFYATVRPKYDNGENFYYLNSWCINSPGNICPYVGYFAEGLFAQSARGYTKDPLGNTVVQAIEYSPALKSKYDVGVSDVSLDLASKCSKICFYVKPYSETPKTELEIPEDYLHKQFYDKRWGTNCVMFVAYETEDEMGKNVTYVLEMNGTAYDKKSGSGKRRYHFHAGHYNFLNNANAIHRDDFDDDTDNKEDYVYVNDQWYIPKIKKYSDGADTSNSYNIADDEYEINDDDVKIFTADGIPAKITNKDILSLYFSPRNFDVSSAVWADIEWECYANAKIDIEFEVEIPIGEIMQNFKAAFSYNGVKDVAINDFFNGDNAPYKNTANYTIDGNPITGTEYATEANFNIIKSAMLNIFAGAMSAGTYTNWEMTSEEPRHYKGRIIVDNQDKSFFEQYFKRRSEYDKTWKDGYSFDGLHAYDIGINNQDGIRSVGTIEATLLSIGRFQYRPFVHASPADSFAFSYDGETINVNAGTKLYLVSSYFVSERNMSASDAMSATVSLMNTYANQYIDNPNYYGMDRNGLWTTNVVRPDPENDSWNNLTADRESWVSTLNFNWNIMQKLFDTDKKYYPDMAKYAAVDDGDDPGLSYDHLDFADEWYRDSDLPHSILNKPIRMHNMARAAYYVSPIAGANYGRITNVIVSADRENVGNFVGFVGSIAGKQERGVVESANVYASDKFTYWEDAPAAPDRAYLTDAEYEQAYNDYTAKKAAYNFQVRYKQTPIMPSAVSNALQTLGDNPDDDLSEWMYYPAEGADLVDEDILAKLSATTATTGLTDYLDSLGVTLYSSTSGQVGDYICSSYTANPNYVFEKRFWDCSAPIIRYTSAWYDDYKTTATEHFDDVMTYKLRPIFNAGGLFGKIVPTYNDNKIELTGGNVQGTLLNHIDVHYVLADANAYSALTTVQAVENATKDIHNTYGAIAGLVEVQTSELGSWDYKNINSVNMGSINVSAEGNTSPNNPLAPFGFIAYQPTELNTVQATQSSPRRKRGDFCGEYTETTWALDAPITINNTMYYTSGSYAYAPINQSSAAFFLADKMPNDTTTMHDYMQAIANKLFSPYSGREGFTVNINGSTLSYCNDDAVDFRKTRKGPMSIQASFGSNVTFEPAATLISASASAAPQEILNIYDANYRQTRTYSMSRNPILANSNFHNVTQFAPVNVDCLRDAEIFNNKSDIDDKYFSYTYSSTSAFIDDWTFKQNVKFTSALKDADISKTATMNEKASFGYVFSDALSHSADGFAYRNNYLHIGNSVSPSYIRDQIKEPGALLHTSACSGAYYDETGELVSATDDRQFGGLLVLDSQNRTVMFIDNISGSRIEGGTWNMACEPVSYQNSRGGMLLEVK